MTPPKQLSNGNKASQFACVLRFPFIKTFKSDLDVSTSCWANQVCKEPGIAETLPKHRTAPEDESQICLSDWFGLKLSVCFFAVGVLSFGLDTASL